MFTGKRNISQCLRLVEEDQAITSPAAKLPYYPLVVKRGRGATVEDVRRMKKTAGNLIRVKAAGGVRNYEDALAMIEAGASRIGTSGGISIVEGGSNAGPGSGY